MGSIWGILWGRQKKRKTVEGLPCDGIWEPFGGGGSGVELGQKRRKTFGYGVTWFGADLGRLVKIGVRKERRKPHQKLPQKKVVTIIAPCAAPKTAPICECRVSKGFFYVKKKYQRKKTALYSHQAVHQFCTTKKVSFGADSFRVRSGGRAGVKMISLA